MAPPGYKLSLREALISSIDHIYVRLAVPAYLGHLHIPFLSPFVRRVTQEYDELGRHMLDLIGRTRAARKAGVELADGSVKGSLFRRLLDANEETSEGEQKLSDGELLSNVFVCPVFN